MGRELKFRFWDRKAGKMVDWNTLCQSAFNDEHHAPALLYQVFAGTIFDGELLQYTGLKDRNGKEIYEGDIVSWQHYEAEHEIQRAAPVTFENGCFYTIWQDSKYRLGGWKAKAIEVIGNIYSNPDLLEAS